MKHLTQLFLLLLIFSCASPMKNFEKGNYEKAFRGALSELEDGKRRKNKDILNRSFNEMLKAHTTDYNLLMYNGAINDWESAYRLRDKLIVNYIKGKRWLSDDFDFQLEELTTEQNQLAIDIASEFRNLGDDAMSVFDRTGDKIAAQDAYAFYNNVLEYEEGDDDILMAISEALVYGTVYVLVDGDSWDFSYEWDIDRKFKNIERESEGFLQVYYEQDVVNPDCAIEIDFNSLNIKTTQDTDRRDFTKRIQDGYETVQDTSGTSTKTPKYIDVEGSVNIIKEFKNYFWEARVKVNRNSDYCDFRSKNFGTEFIAEKISYELFGDRRAIPSEYTTSSGKKYWDDEDDIVEDMIDEIYDDIVRHYF